jgi:hypothetical protein
MLKKIIRKTEYTNKKKKKKRLHPEKFLIIIIKKCKTIK